MEGTKKRHYKGRTYILEPAKTTVTHADTLSYGLTLPFQLRLTGKFYNGIGYPPGYKPGKGDPRPARVFQYNMLSIIEPNNGVQHRLALPHGSACTSCLM